MHDRSVKLIGGKQESEHGVGTDGGTEEERRRARSGKRPATGARGAGKGSAGENAAASPVGGKAGGEEVEAAGSPAIGREVGGFGQEGRTGLTSSSSSSSSSSSDSSSDSENEGPLATGGREVVQVRGVKGGIVSDEEETAVSDEEESAHGEGRNGQGTHVGLVGGVGPDGDAGAKESPGAGSTGSGEGRVAGRGQPAREAAANCARRGRVGGGGKVNSRGKIPTDCSFWLQVGHGAR